MNSGAIFKLVLGAVLLGLGSFVAVRPLWAPHATLTQSRLLDLTFAAVFLLRGAMNVRTAMRARHPASAPRS